MSARRVLAAAWCGARAAFRVTACFLGGSVLGSALLAPAMGPFAMILPFGAAMLGFPALCVAIALRLIFDRSIRAHLLGWSIAAPFVVVPVFLVFDYLLIRKRGDLGPLGYLKEPYIPAQVGLVALFATIAAALHYLWERRRSRRRCGLQASS